MDNFMDKLSNRFHAGELIRANGEAEAKQMQKLKAQNEEQAQVLSEVRRLNLKTAEISEQISQMAALSIEKLEEYDTVRKAEPEKAAENAGDIAEGTGWELEMYQGMSQLHIELQNVENLESSLMAFQETQTEYNNKFTEMMNQAIEAQNRPSSWQTEVWQSMSLMQQQLQNVEQLAGSQASMQEQLHAEQSDFHKKMEVTGQDVLQKIEDLKKENDESYEQQTQRLLGKLRETESSTQKMLEQLTESTKPSEKPAFVYEIEAILSEIENNLATSRKDLSEQIGSVAASVSDADRSNLKNEIAQSIRSENESIQQTLNQVKELVVGLRVYVDEVEKRTEDFVHKEDVKVYRNVQNVVMETVSARSRDISDRLDGVEKRVEGMKGIKPLLIFTCLFSLASLALSVLQMLGILNL
ncbi:MAG: hypothetical protein K6E84_07485 [Lachnospiraceae bacterium]|nr:hypothetical protein [Lachnospiraceae bacterium]